MSPQTWKLSFVFIFIAAVTAVSAFYGYTSEVERQEQKRSNELNIGPRSALSREVSRDRWSTSH
jgi:hypothetical protein